MKKMVIIGAGVSGLSAGCYAAMNGYDVQILEMGATPGGVCVSWKRGDYLFDHCLHWVLGSNKGSSFYPLFEELGVVPEVAFHHTDRFRSIEGYGKKLVVYTDIDKLEAELCRVFPGERKALHRMMKQVRFYTRFMPPMDADFGSFGFSDILKLLPYMPSFLRLKRISIEDYFNKLFRDPQLREFLFRMFPVHDMPAVIAVMPLAYFHNRQGGYPMGGSLHFARAIEKRYLALGGRVTYGRKVERIIVKDGRAIGVELGGEQLLADIVVSACDGRSTLYGMLQGRYLTAGIREMYDQPSLWPPIICVSLGVDRDLTGEVELSCVKLDEPADICGRPVEWLYYTHYCQDPSFAPKGKSVIKLQIETDFTYWKTLYENKTAYRAEKGKVLEFCIAALEKVLPGIRAQIEVTDVATPVTWERYTGNWQGSYEGWLPTVKLFGKFLPRELPGLKGFYMTGQWLFPGGGVPMCMSQARRLVKEICTKDGKSFRVDASYIVG